MIETCKLCGGTVKRESFNDDQDTVTSKLICVDCQSTSDIHIIPGSIPLKEDQSNV